MPKINRGKDFETCIRKAVECLPEVSIDRFADPGSRFKGVCNICDFGIYKKPLYLYLECKATWSSTLNYKSAIRQNQWEGLLEKSKISGIRAGVVVWFIEQNFTAFVPIGVLDAERRAGKRSLNVKQLLEANINHIRVFGFKKRVLNTYDGELFMRCLLNADKEKAEDWWEGRECLKN